MPKDERWGTIQSLKGWTIQPDDDSDLVKAAHLKRRPDPYDVYRKRSEAEHVEYGELDGTMHKELRRISKEHFAGTPPPTDVDPKDWLAEYYTPFTYQNEDWYGPTYVCGIGVRTDYVCSELLRKLQTILAGDYQDWCICVYSSASLNFDNDYELFIFSDQVIVPINAAKAFKVPEVSK